MKTDDLIAMLATNAEPVVPAAPVRQYAPALGAGVAGSMLVMLFVLDLGFRPDMGQAILLPMFWIKLAFPLATGFLALAVVSRLARPGMPLGIWPATLILPTTVIWVLAGLSIARAQPAEAANLVSGISWQVCTFYITAIALPPFVAAMWAMRGMAPTRLVLSGAAAGLLAGAIGAAVYALYCPEMEPVFLGIWYLLGMLVPAAIGAALGRWILRW